MTLLHFFLLDLCCASWGHTAASQAIIVSDGSARGNASGLMRILFDYNSRCWLTAALQAEPSHTMTASVVGGNVTSGQYY